MREDFKMGKWSATIELDCPTFGKRDDVVLTIFTPGTVVTTRLVENAYPEAAKAAYGLLKRVMLIAETGTLSPEEEQDQEAYNERHRES